MKLSRRFTLAGLFLSPALTLAQAPTARYDQPAVVRGQAPAGPPMTMPAVPGTAAPITPITPTTPVTPAPAAAPAADCGPAACEEPAAPADKFVLEKLLGGIPAFKTLGDNGWRIYGWTQGSYNASSASRSNLPVPFIDRANEFSLMQNWLHIEKAIDTSKKEYQVGGAVDLILPGTDARFTIARGLGDQQTRRGELYPIDLFQAYVDVFSPNVGPQGTTFRVGKFATFLEYEVVQGVSNPFLSRAYNFQYDPFTHTGALAITPLNDTWTVANGLVLGNDVFIDPAAQATYLAHVVWAPKNGRTTATLGWSVTNPRFNVNENFPVYNDYNLIVTHKITDKLTYALDTSYSHMYDVPGVGFANWYGFANYLLYQVSDNLAWNNRLEFFDDVQGVRTGASGLYTAVTTGFTWKPVPWLYLMPEVRYDYNNGPVGPFEGDRDLFTAAIGAIVRW